MNRRLHLGKRYFFILLALLLLPLAGTAVAAETPVMVGGVPAAEALRLGERMYREGVLPSGRLMRGSVRSDIVISGAMVNCAKCHLRSGLGSYEGGVPTLPTNGRTLFAPLHRKSELPGMLRMIKPPTRPAYTETALADALRLGVDPAGRTLDETMPRYELDDAETAILVHYLKHLSAEFSPGVGPDGVRLATVVAGKVSPDDRQAMLDGLTAYLRQEWNDYLPVLAQLQRDTSFRPLILDVWELQGPPDTWEEQLEAYYRRQPVFALVGGLAGGPWRPVHRFCEKNRIPSLLPVTSLPEISSGDWYTLYLSKGYHQEGETAAKFLARVFDLPADKQLLQVFRESEEGRALARSFAGEWKKLGKAPLAEQVLPAGLATGREFWARLAAAHPNAVVLLWLDAADLAGIEALGEAAEKPSLLFFSGALLAGEYAALPDRVREFSFLTHPTRLPGERTPVESIVPRWLKARKIESANAAISPHVYFLTRVLGNAFTAMRGNFYRDHFLELVDTLPDQTTTSPAFPRLSFGPGQRYAAKGCYVVRLTPGESPQVIRQGDWVIY